MKYILINQCEGVYEIHSDLGGLAKKANVSARTLKRYLDLQRAYYSPVGTIYLAEVVKSNRGGRRVKKGG